MNAALFILFAVAQARFGQENIPIADIAAVQGGDPGAAATIAGAAISDLLAGANACAKLQRADQILEELGTGDDAIAAAIGMVSAEKNVNPFAETVPTICNDATLPANEILRGITPLVDPEFANADVANALSAETVATPLDATGKSVADLLIENGFTDFLEQGLDGVKVEASADAGEVVDAGEEAVDAGEVVDAGDAAATEVVDTAVAAVETATATAETAAAVVTDACAAQVAEALASASANHAAATATAEEVAEVTEVAAVDTATAEATATETAAAAEETAVVEEDDAAVEEDAAADDAAAEEDVAVEDDAAAEEDAAAEVEEDAGADAAAGEADFGVCDPTIQFQGGQGGRPADEFTFQSQDANIAAIQQEALNPNIITNRICDELTNQCEANEAAIALCEDAQAQIEALGTRDVTTAETWNELLGFAGTVTNPDGGPATPEEAAAVADARLSRRRRGFRA